MRSSVDPFSFGATAGRRIAIAEPISSVFNGLRRHFRVVPLLGRYKRLSVPREKRKSRLSPLFLKKNTGRQPVWQEIVDFSVERPPLLDPVAFARLQSAGPSDLIDRGR
jgi:hypothetical protein